ncbi:MAG TPA: CDP-alcohol phosphatidyltransferase family protein [Candidatus Poseidoniia archaeon]|jgi:archaetidylinositol phosphate synthase|nr:CDP-alcohol phosphatidyltransferase family protein [Candidatus Poseidoniia archaeon]|tara:strand:+ start:2751 stop:3380 length:630 start_codon:yes stop_codon:yes gene_type:complete
MLSKTLKTAAGKLLNPLGKGIGKIGIKPNHITVMGLILTFYAAWLLYQQNIYGAFIVGLISSLFDGADGLVARSTKTTSIRGGYLDATLDRYADCIAFSAIILCDWVKPLPIVPLESISGQVWAMAAMIGAFQTSYCRAAAERLGVSQEGIGLIERPERWFVLGMGLLVGEMMGNIETVITIVVAILAVLGNLTALQRMYHFWNEAKDE